MIGFMKTDKKILIAIGVIAVVAAALYLVKTDDARREEYRLKPGTGPLKVSWRSERYDGLLSGPGTDFRLTFRSDEAEPLIGCAFEFDGDKRFDISSIGFTTPDLSFGSSRYSGQLQDIKPGIEYALGQDSDSRGIDLAKRPKVVKLECTQGISEWVTGY